ncbi:MAG: FAD-dependent oxidoreductase, partial [Paraprevotella sp.]|nr:FAD-dependent oxidoreductase [Paraprevotella sp.]
MNHSKVLIIGSGPAGYTAAIYAGRAGLNPVIMEGLQPGGQLTTTTIVDNYPGFSEGVDANELMENMRSQAERFGATIHPHAVEKVDLDVRPFKVWTDEDEEYTADAIIIATGASAKYLGLADEQKYMGMGVSACATCDG